MACENGACNINGGGGEVKTRRRNKYAYACAMLASMSSILLGYGLILSLPAFSSMTEVFIIERFMITEIVQYQHVMW